MTITGQSSLSKDDIQQMVRDAEAHADEDRQRREEAEIRNKAENLSYQTEKLLREQGEKLSDEERAKVDERLRELKVALDGEDLIAIGNATEMLMLASQDFTQKLYQAAAQEENQYMAGNPTTSTAPDDDEVVDAEIVDDAEG